MKKDIRQQKILDYLSHFGRVSISEICEMFDIVPMTARRDLKELEDDHKLIRTHGGATLPSLSIHDTTLPFHQRMTQNIELKESIARAALPYVQKIAESNLNSFQLDCAFIGVNAVDEEGNIFLGSMAEASIVRLLCHMVPEIYFLADETKLMKKDFIYICQLGKGRNLITNSSISKKYIHTYEQLGACVITESQKDRR